MGLTPHESMPAVVPRDQTSISMRLVQLGPLERAIVMIGSATLIRQLHCGFDSEANGVLKGSSACPAALVQHANPVLHDVFAVKVDLPRTRVSTSRRIDALRVIYRSRIRPQGLSVWPC